jgi:hypothetical protein
MLLHFTSLTGQTLCINPNCVALIVKEGGTTVLYITGISVPIRVTASYPEILEKFAKISFK